MEDTCCLILETSTPHGSVALAMPDGALKIREFSSDRSHNAVLFPPLQELLDGRGEKKIGLVLVGSGPGSYSGTRVGIAAAQGVAIALGCPAVALPSILAVPSASQAQPCLAIGDARRGSYWTAKVEHLHLLSAPELTDLSGLQEILETHFAAGLSVFSFEDPSRFSLPAELREHVKLEFPSAARLWQAWRDADAPTRAAWAAEIPQPIYLKPPHITPAKRPWLVQ